MKQPLGTLLVVSGPSGSGKTTLCRRATENGLCVYSISCTTRQPRPGEVNGVDYHFLTPAEFDARVERGDFLEYAEVHGNRYGTLKADILTLLEQGKNVVMDIDVQGAGQVRSCREGILPLCYADVYIYVPQAELKTAFADGRRMALKRLPCVFAMRNRKTPACRSTSTAWFPPTARRIMLPFAPCSNASPCGWD
ncbi:guanylate kinase [Akkermansia muciniphila]|nr:guanylate kinase [Akkermansia muciniphila]